MIFKAKMLVIASDKVRLYKPYMQVNKLAVVYTQICYTHTYSNIHTLIKDHFVSISPPTKQLLSSPVNLTNPLGIHYRLYEKQLHYFSPSAVKEHHK